MLSVSDRHGGERMSMSILKEVEFEQVSLSIEQIEATSAPNIQQLIKEREIMEQVTVKEKNMALQIIADWYEMSTEAVKRAVQREATDIVDSSRVERRALECIARSRHVTVPELEKALDNSFKFYIVAVPGMGNRYYKRDETTGEILGETSPTKIGAGRFSLKELEEDFPELRPFVVSHITCSN